MPPSRPTRPAIDPELIATGRPIVAALDDMRLGEHVRAIRERLGLDRDGLADELDVAATTIYRWETGRVRPANLGMILAALATLLVAAGDDPALAYSPQTREYQL